MAVRNHAKPLLQVAYGVAQVEIEMAVEIGNLVAESASRCCSAMRCVARGLEIVGGPAAAEGRKTAQPVGKAATASA